MEIVEVAKQLFENKEIRILGTPEEPLFIANDIEKILELKNIHVTIKDFDNTEKVISNPYHLGVNQNMMCLTEKGLYRVLYTSRKPLAKQFQNWVFTVLKEIRLKGRYDLLQKIEEQKQAIVLKVEEPLAQTNEIVIAENIAIIETDQIEIDDSFQLVSPDINDYRDCNVVYLLHVYENDYKFGITDDTIRRLSEHKTHFKKHNHEINVVRLWKCKNSIIMRSIEDKIKTLSKENDILRKKYDLTEIFETSNVNLVIEKIDQYVAESIDVSDKIYEMEMAKMRIKEKETDNENLRLQIELLKLSKGIGENVNLIEYNNNILDETQIDQPDTSEQSINWIKTNNPSEKQAASDYYNKYTKAMLASGIDTLSIQKFSKLVKDLGFKSVRGDTFRRWKKV